jgi:imidazolonepropionase-like amidohydrolase
MTALFEALNLGKRYGDARVVELGGRTVMPGLIDCHVHVCADGMVSYPTLFPSLVTARAAQLLNETLLRGFTTIRDLGGTDDLLPVLVQQLGLLRPGLVPPCLFPYPY